MRPWRTRALRLLILALGLGLGWTTLEVTRSSWRPRAELVVGNGPEPRSLDPSRARSSAEGRLMSFLFEGLTRPDAETLDPLPGLASTWSAADGARRWTFTLRRGLRWSDGYPIRADDLRWSYLRLLRFESLAPYKELLWVVRGARAFSDVREARPPDEARVGIRAPDHQTLVFELEHPLPHFPEILSAFALYPVPRHVIERHGEAWVRQRPLVGCGPYVLVERRLRDRLRLEKNPHYHSREAVAIETVDLLVADGHETFLNLWLAGSCDWIQDVPVSAVPGLLARRGPETTGEFRPSPYLATTFYKLNTVRPPLNEPRVRRALALAIDKEAVTRRVTMSGERAATSLVPPEMLPGYQPPRGPTHDAGRARALLRAGLRELGLEEAPVLEILYSKNVLNRRVAEFVQEAWRSELGVQARLVEMEWGPYKQAIRDGRYYVARGSWVADYRDPGNFLSIFSSTDRNNGTGWPPPGGDATPEYDALLERARESSDPAARNRLYRAAEALLLESGAIIPLFHDVTRPLVRRGLEGWHSNALDLHPPQELRWAEGAR